MKKSKRYRPVERQFDTSAILTGTVQFWRNGVMLTAMMSRDRAVELVSRRAAFVICEQAIGAVDAEGYANS